MGDISPSNGSVIYMEPSEPTEEGIPMQMVATFTGVDNPEPVEAFDPSVDPTPPPPAPNTVAIQKAWAGYDGETLYLDQDADCGSSCRQGCGVSSIVWKEGDTKRDVWQSGLYPVGIPYNIWIKYVRRELLSALSFATTKWLIRKWWEETACMRVAYFLVVLISMAFTLVADIFLLVALLLRAVLFPLTLLTFGPFALCNNHKSVPACSGRWWCIWSSLWILGASGWGLGAIFLKPCSCHSAPTYEDREIDWCC